MKILIGICIIAAALAAVSQVSGATTENPERAAKWSKIILKLEEFEKLMLPAIKELIDMAKKDNAEAGAFIGKYWGSGSWLWSKLKGEVYEDIRLRKLERFTVEQNILHYKYSYERMQNNLKEVIPKLSESVVKVIKEKMERTYKQGLALLKEAEEIHKNI